MRLRGSREHGESVHPGSLNHVYGPGGAVLSQQLVPLRVNAEVWHCLVTMGVAPEHSRSGVHSDQLAPGPYIYRVLYQQRSTQHAFRLGLNHRAFPVWTSSRHNTCSSNDEKISTNFKLSADDEDCTTRRPVMIEAKIRPSSRGMQMFFPLIMAVPQFSETRLEFFLR